MQLFDTHCHLAWGEPKIPVDEQLRNARAAGVDEMVCVATDLENARRCRDLAARESGMRCSVGIHPNDVGHEAAALRDLLAELESLAAEPGWSALGETGLDHYRDWADPDRQRESLEFHFELSRKTGLPVIIHCREAAAPLLETVRAFGGPFHGVMHCYSEGPEPLDELLALGFYISYAGNVTYPKAEAIRASALLVPEERLLIETDAPFLAPQPMRGKPNQPAYVRHTLEHLAELRGADPEALAAATHQNAVQLFGPEPSVA